MTALPAPGRTPVERLGLGILGGAAGQGRAEAGSIALCGRNANDGAVEVETRCLSRERAVPVWRVARGADGAFRDWLVPGNSLWRWPGAVHAWRRARRHIVPDGPN
jgi:hypothetical protein